MAHDDLHDHGTGNSGSTGSTPSGGFADHGLEGHESTSHAANMSGAASVGGPGFVPMAEPIMVDTGGPGGTVAFTPNPEGPGTVPNIPLPNNPQLPQLPGPQLTYPKYCNLSLPGGCYRLSFRPQK